MMQSTIDGTQQEVLTALYERGTNMTAVAAILGAEQVALRNAMRRWCSDGVSNQLAPRGKQARAIVKELNRQLREYRKSQKNETENVEKVVA